MRVIATNVAGQSAPSAVVTVAPPGGLVVAAAPGGPRPPLAVVALGVPPSIARATLAAVGMPLAVTVAAGTTMVRMRVLTPGGRPRARVLYATTHAVKAADRTRTVRFRLRSRRLYARVRPGRRYLLEVAAGVSRTKLGAASRVVFRVR